VGARQEKGPSLRQLGRRDEAISVWADAVRRNPRLALVNNELAGAKQSSGKLEETSSHEKQADQFTPNDPLYHWVLGRRLQDPGMTDLAENICSKQANSVLRMESLININVTQVSCLCYTLGYPTGRGAGVG
jgi:tetratricopeptide (TPR) repeat protein